MLRRTVRKIHLGDSILLSALVGIGLALLLIQGINRQIRPIMIELATARVNNQVVRLLAQTVEGLPMDYDRVVTLEKDDQGRITALKSDMAAVSAYRHELLSLLVEEMDHLKKQEMDIPLGSLTGVDLLSGRGPGIPVKVLSVGAANSSFENDFQSAGINQTRHQILLNITVTASILLPGKTTQTEINTQMCVAETVIVGNVPENFTYFSQMGDAKDAADHYFDYGAGQ